jgi:LDH2 family malate/lactate/ureidoglycolate dehydrogenase
MALLETSGMPHDKSLAITDILMEGDLMGHDTHGFQLLPSYLEEIHSKGMTCEGDPEVISDVGAVLTWDGKRLPGQWLMLQALEQASARARQFGMGAVCIRRSHHIAALAPYARRVALQGQILLLMTSAPAGASVAPYGGTQALFSPSPIGFGVPTSQDPILVDVSTSITTNGLTNILAKEGKKLPGPWVIDEQGQPTDDPSVVIKPREGTLLPLGGTDVGHKGYGLSLMVEAMTAGLSGHGKADPVYRLGASLFVQVLDPQAFSGTTDLHRQMDWLVDKCKSNKPVDATRPVRLPGERGLQLWREQQEQGIVLKASVQKNLAVWAEKLKVTMPTPQVG